MADPIVDLGSKVEDDVIITFTNNLSAIPCEVRIANATSSISSPTSCIFSTKSTSRVKRV
jgi:hypothetical protein